MPFALKLFRINFQHTYYTKGVSEDFRLTPDNKTKEWMQKHNMRLVSYNGAFELIWLIARLENPIQIFEQKLANHHLNFYVEINNPSVFNFSLLTIDLEKIYYFTNANANANANLNANNADAAGFQRLHQKDYVGEVDKVSLQDIDPEIINLTKNIFGIINIQLDKLWKGKINAEQLPIEYTIQIKARETTWCYQVVDLHNRIKGPTKVVIDADDSYFIYKGNGENKHIHLYESIKPIALKDQINQTFSLRMYPELSNKKIGNTTNQAETLVENLPFQKETLVENLSLQNETLVENLPLQKETLVENLPFQKETLVENLSLRKETLVEKLPLQEEILIEKLPLPDVHLVKSGGISDTQLVRSREKGSVFYSNVVVYV